MSIKVHYFAGYGRAEAVRMLLAHAKVAFEDVSYTFETLPEAKASGNLEFGQLPVLEIDGKFYAQSWAILRFAGKKYGYYPEDAYESWRVDSTLDAIGDLLNAFYKASFNPDEETKKALFQVFYDTTFPKWLDVIEKRVAANSSPDHIVGDKVTIADFALAALAYSTFLNEANPTKDQQLAIVEKYPKLLDYFRGMGEKLKDHLASRKPSPW
jgi:glutathione S-transferase